MTPVDSTQVSPQAAPGGSPKNASKPARGIKRIGVLTSGGDCPGLNSILRAVTLRAHNGYGWDVVGIEEGTRGLMARPVKARQLKPGEETKRLLRLGGTVLGTINKGDPFAFPQADGSVVDRSSEVIEGFETLGLDALIGIGGDGSMKILSRLATMGAIPFIGIPKTIDNDVAFTEFAVGFPTAVATCVDALDRLQPTAASHHRVMILEVMGRDAGHLALHAGIAGGADVILIPEIPFRMDVVAEKVKGLKEQGLNHGLIVVSEAIHLEGGDGGRQAYADGEVRYGGVGHKLGDALARATGAEVRVTVLGHVQRGGIPGSRDRVLASAFGVHAVDLLAKGQTNRMVAWANRNVIDVTLDDVVATENRVDPKDALIKTAKGLGICLGDA
ncbi:MAG: ATP-dependent 6-phosphofructokinase [Magnetovibrionaceae bacterium]